MDMHFDGVIFQTHAAELARRVERPHPPFCVIDVRPAGEWESGRIPGSISLPDGIGVGLPPGTTELTEFFVVGAIQEDPAARRASLALRRLGARRCVELTGGFPEWLRAGLATESGRLAA